MAWVLNFLIRYFSNYYTLHRSDLAARAAPLDPRLRLKSITLLHFYDFSTMSKIWPFLELENIHQSQKKINLTCHLLFMCFLIFVTFISLLCVDDSLLVTIGKPRNQNNRWCKPALNRRLGKKTRHYYISHYLHRMKFIIYDHLSCFVSWFPYLRENIFSLFIYIFIYNDLIVMFDKIKFLFYLHHSCFLFYVQYLC